MRTYTHGIVGYLLYFKGTLQQKKLAVIGAMIPDLFLVLGFPFHLLPKTTITDFFHNLFHHSGLHSLTELMHSVTLIVPLLILAYFFYKIAIPFFIGMLSHVFLDLITHQQWAYNHFYPIPIAPIVAPLTYTSIWFTLLEHLFVIGFLIWFFKRKSKSSSNRSSKKLK